MTDLDPKLEQALGSYRRVSGGRQYVFKCPFCLGRVGKVDTHGHLYLTYHPKKGSGLAFKCQRCGLKGRGDYLYNLLGIPSNASVSDYYDDSEDPITEESSVGEKTIQLPRGSYYVIKGSEAYRYLLSRGLSEEDITYYAFMESPEIPGRVIIPDWYPDGTVWFWTARSFTGSKLRYLHAETGSGDRIYRYYVVRHLGYREVVVCEGPISAQIAGYDAVATYGMGIKGQQVSMLCDLNVDLLLAFDGDALRQSVIWCEALLASGFPRDRLKILKLPNKTDPADLGRDNFNLLRKQAIRYNKFDALFLGA